MEKSVVIADVVGFKEKGQKDKPLPKQLTASEILMELSTNQKTVPVQSNVSPDFRDRIKELAENSGMSVSKLCHNLLVLGYNEFTKMVEENSRLTYSATFVCKCGSKFHYQNVAGMTDGEVTEQGNKLQDEHYCKTCKDTYHFVKVIKE